MKRFFRVALFCGFATAGLALSLCASSCMGQDSQEKIYSGPQPTEELPSFLMKGVFGEQAGKDIDVAQVAGGSPTIVIFFHERNRPAFAMTNALMKYATTRQKDGLVSAVCFLGDDFSETADWLQRVQRNLTDKVLYGVSQEGIEGPGAYGLNRNVSLTVLVAKDGHVTANFALLQPSIRADGQEIMKALADVLGGGEVPALADYAPSGRGDAAPTRNDTKLAELVRSLFPMTDEKELEKRVAEIEDYVQQRPQLKAQLIGMASRFQNSPRMESVRLDAVKDQFKKWASETNQVDRPMQAADAADSDRIRGLLTGVIRKNASDEQVEAAATKVEEETKQDPALRKAIGEAAKRVVNSGKLENYGTAKAQEFLKKWAVDFLKEDR